MAETTPKYSCQTQDGESSTFGAAPVSHLHPGHDHPDTVVVGIGSIVPRWDVVTQPNRTLQYFVQADTFPEPDYVTTAATALEQATQEWNDVGVGLTIKATDDSSAANFFLSYTDPNDPKNTTLARAFFPNQADQDVLVYKWAFDPRNQGILKNVFLHELGHVLGLRHEFAITGDPDKRLKAEGAGARQFGLANYYSVMSYNFPPNIQQSDIDGLREFYKLKNGTMIGGSPVTDYLPQVRNTT